MLVGSGQRGRFLPLLFLLLLQLKNFGILDDGMRIVAVGYAVMNPIHAYARYAFPVNSLIEVGHLHVGERYADLFFAKFEVCNGSIPGARHQLRSTPEQSEK